jgi:serine phosphatase RsbU (regulator of sigma subunit)
MLWWLPSAANGQAAFTLTAEQLQNGQAVELDKLGWKYAPNDDPQFAEPQFDDRAWETLNGTAITLNNIPKSGWRGLGWFRLRLQVDPALANQPLALVMVHYGASEVYLDGKLLERFGTVGATPDTEVEYNPNTVPLGLVLDGRGEHVIAVRHSCIAMRDLTSWSSRWLHRLASRRLLKTVTNRTNEFGAGFGIGMQALKQAQTNYDVPKSLDGSGFGLYGSCIGLAIGLLHLLLYWFYPGRRANLFFGLFACFVSVWTTAQYLLITGHYGAQGIIFLSGVSYLSIFIFPVFLLAFLYTVFLLRLPRRFWLWLIAAGSLWFAGQINLLDMGGMIFIALVLVEALRLVIQAIRNNVDEAWLTGIGLLLGVTALFIAGVYQLTGADIPFILRIMMILSIMLPPSIFLARSFARTNLDLEAQLVQVKQLSAEALEHEKVKAENERRAAELEEARQLQLSMLPKKLPQLPHLDLAAHMQTASEVGGDYYDFHLGDDGTLTVAVGDATGHGLKAGTMVAAVKSLFVTLAYHPDIPHIFTRMSQTLKQMQMRGVFMALALVKCNERRVNVAIAGMPPLLVYRQATNTVERINLTGLPLGSVTSYRYREMTTEMEPGDVLLLLSDGLTELFNPADEMLGEERVEQCLQACAQSAPDEIIARLLAAAEAWAEGRKLDDDLTLVVLKAK